LARRHGGRHDHVEGIADLPSALTREAAQVVLPESRSGPLDLFAEAEYRNLLETLRVDRDSRIAVVSPREGTEVAMRDSEGDAMLTFGRAGWGRVAFLAANPGQIATVGGERGAERLLRVAAAHGVAGQWRGGVESRVIVGRGEIDLEIGATDTLPEVRVRRPDGLVETVSMEWNAPGRASGSLETPLAGEYLLEMDGVRRRVWRAAVAERMDTVRAPSWSEGIDDPSIGAGEGGFSPGSVRPRIIDLAPILLALAALLFFIDSVARITRPGELFRGWWTARSGRVRS
jgi:hypothetical protein